MYKVFINNRPLFFTSELQIDEKTTCSVVHSQEELLKIVGELERGRVDKACVLDKDGSCWEMFQQSYQLIEAAGGIVFNQKREGLFIYRLEKWDLPKGKIDPGENPREAAVREIEEECGISGVTIEKELQQTYHTYSMNGDKILKRTYWFEMNYSGNEKLVPQIEEDITKVEWKELSQLDEVIKNTYPNIIDLLNRIV